MRLPAHHIHVYFVYEWYHEHLPVRKLAPTELSFRTADLSCPLCAASVHTQGQTGPGARTELCFGSPVCWSHNSIKYSVKIKDSTIPNAGKGLFATRRLPKKSWICPYSGEPTTMSCIHKRCSGGMTAVYTEHIPGPANHAFDCACSRGVGSLANALFKPYGNVSALSRHNCLSRYRPVGDGIPGAWLKSTRVIKAGDETFN